MDTNGSMEAQRVGTKLRGGCLKTCKPAWMEPSSIESFGFSRIVIVSSGQFMCRHGEHDVDKGRYLIGWFDCHLWWLRGVTSCLI